MNLLAVQRILGLLVMLVSVTMLPPLGVSLYYGDGNWPPFLHAFVALLAVGALIWWPARGRVRELRVRDGFLVVALFWFVVGAAGAVPLLLAEDVQLSVTNAVFESVSGFTTTGATVLSGLDSMPKSLLYYRMQMEWLGGIGMVVLAVALLPMLGVGGMQLMRAETPGPIKDSKLTPRITGTAKELCRIYIAITIACAAAYKLAGMSTFDAIAHSFSTVSTGGNSTHDANFGYFNNEVIEGIAVFFMFLGGVNFSLHFLAWRHKRLINYFRDPEFRAYMFVLLLAIVVYFLVLWLSQPNADPGHAFRRSLFHAVSMQTSSGFFTDDFTHWPGALPVILMLSTFIGGCAGSTSGGMKVVRWLRLW
jgi:trk system potassium uptake protein TrkH